MARLSNSNSAPYRAPRAEEWHSHICRLFTELSLEKARQGTFVGNARTKRIGELQFTNIRAGGQRVRRGKREIQKQESDQFFLILQNGGQCRVFSEQGDAVEMLPGDSVLVNPQTPYILNFENPADQICIQIPGEDLVQRVSGSTNLVIGRKIERDNSVSRILLASVADLAETAEKSAEEIEASIELFYDVLAGCLKNISRIYSVRSQEQKLTKFNALVGFIVSHHDRADLSPADAAAELGMSVRNLSRLCYAQGTTFTKLVLNSRLTAAAHALREFGGDSHGLITHVAFEHGFSDLSHFSKSFKEKYGVSPVNFAKNLK